MLQRVADVLGLVGHEGAQRLDQLQLIGEQLVGRYAVGAVHRRHGQAEDVAVCHVEPSAGADDDDVAVADGHGRRESSVIGADNLLRSSGRHADEGAHAPRLADQRLLRVRYIDDAGPARAAAIAADQAEPGLGSLENQDVGGGMVDRVGE